MIKTLFGQLQSRPAYGTFAAFFYGYRIQGNRRIVTGSLKKMKEISEHNKASIDELIAGMRKFKVN